MCDICDTHDSYLALAASAAADALRAGGDRAAAEAVSIDLAERLGLNEDDVLPDILQMMEADQAGGTAPSKEQR